MTLNSSTVTAATDATADQYNNLRKDVLQGAGDYATTTGSSNAYLLSIDAQITAYEDGLEITCKTNFSNTGACTINVNSIGVKNIKTLAGNDPASGDIPSGAIIKLIYDGTNMVLQRPPTASTSEPGLSEMATNSEASAFTDQTRYINSYQLGAAIGPASSINLKTHRFHRLFPRVGSTADAVVNGWTENNAKLTANQGGGDIIFFDTESSLAATISTLIPGKGSQAYFRFADIGANAIYAFTRVKFGTSPASVNEYLSWGFNNVDGAYNATNDSIRFCLDDNTGDKLYAVTANGTNNKNTDVTGSLTLTNWLNLAMVITSTDVLFYAGGGQTLTLVATHSAASSGYIPTSSTQMDLGWGIRDNGSQPDMYITPTELWLPLT